MRDLHHVLCLMCDLHHVLCLMYDELVVSDI